MRLSKQFFLSFVVLISLFLAGCASVPMASLDQDASAKSFAVRAGKSAIYVYRSESIGGAIPMTVTLDGKVAGQSAMKTFFLFEVDPGPHELSLNPAVNPYLAAHWEA